jgi:hypothetical protein
VGALDDATRWRRALTMFAARRADGIVLLSQQPLTSPDNRVVDPPSVDDVGRPLSLPSLYAQGARGQVTLLGKLLFCPVSGEERGIRVCHATPSFLSGALSRQTVDDGGTYLTEFRYLEPKPFPINRGFRD